MELERNLNHSWPVLLTSVPGCQTQGAIQCSSLTLSLIKLLLEPFPPRSSSGEGISYSANFLSCYHVPSTAQSQAVDELMSSWHRL